MDFNDDSAVSTVPLMLPEVGPVARLMRRLVPWLNPYNTVAIIIVVDEQLMRILREPDVHPADWDIAEALMYRVGHPDRLRRSDSVIRHVSEWDIHQVTSAPEALARYLDSLHK